LFVSGCAQKKRLTNSFIRHYGYIFSITFVDMVLIAFHNLHHLIR